MVKKKTILITGGHLSPAYAVLPLFIKKGYRVIFVGRKHAFTDHQDESLEFRLLSSDSQVSFHPLVTGRFTRGAWKNWLTEAWKMKSGFEQAYKILKQEQPETILSFGGYLAVPICLLARLLRIPVILHEQTIAPGKANRLLSLIAKKVFVSFPESLKFFPKNKCQLSGLVLREQLNNPKKPSWFRSTTKPILLILGGSSGAHSINILIEKILGELTTKFVIIHQTGDNMYRDFERLSAYKNANYFALKHLLPQEIGYFYQQAALVLSRAGANTFFELIKFQKPAILVPLPWSANNEQYKQATILEKHQVAKIFPQSETTNNLLTLINKTYNERKIIAKNFRSLTHYEQLILQPTAFLKKLGL